MGVLGVKQLYEREANNIIRGNIINLILLFEIVFVWTWTNSVPLCNLKICNLPA